MNESIAGGDHHPPGYLRIVLPDCIGNMGGGLAD